jgi:hypothetical protein
VQSAVEFEADPIVLGSIDLKRDQLLKFASLDEPCYCDDLLVLCTDSIAEWALRRAESGDPPAWETYWDMTEQAWQHEIRALRDQGTMRYDDATLVLLRVGPEVAAPQDAEPQRSEPQRAATPAAARQQAEEPAVSVEALEPEAVEAVEPEPVEAVEPGADEVVEPIIVPEEDWVEKLRTISHRVNEGIDQVSDQMLRGMKMLKEKAVQKYRDSIKREKK